VAAQHGKSLANPDGEKSELPFFFKCLRVNFVHGLINPEVLCVVIKGSSSC
jgi:hypothetical protein